MNRTGLLIALAVGVVVGTVFGIFPQLDLKLAALFYDPASKRFPMQASHAANVARDAAMWISWAFALPALISLAMKIILPRSRMLVSPRTTLFLTVSIVLTAGIISNAGFKTYWGRPRPVATAEFGGPWQFKAWWDSSGQCPRNCSFYSGEATTAFWTYAPAALAPPQWRPLAYVAATVFGLATGLLRMTFGGHYFTDVIFGGVMAFLIVWLLHGIYFRWLWSMQSDEEIDARLTGWFLAWANAVRTLFKRLRDFYARKTSA